MHCIDTVYTGGEVTTVRVKKRNNNGTRTIKKLTSKKQREVYKVHGLCINLLDGWCTLSVEVWWTNLLEVVPPEILPFMV